MKKITLILGLLLILAFLVDIIVGERAHSWSSIGQEKLVEEEYLVFLKNKLSDSNRIIAYARSKGIAIDDRNVFTGGTQGFVVRLNSEQVKKLKGFFYWMGLFTKVKKIRPNFAIQTSRPRMQSNPIPQTTRPRMQSGYDSIAQTSLGITFVGGPATPNNLTRKVWVLDTGIDRLHPDLAAQVVTGGGLPQSFVPSESDPYVDGNGHGTFCAGLIGAKSTNPADPFIRMNGVAPGAKLVSVKVLDSNGDGSWGNVLLGLSHALVKSSPGDVISLSLGGDYSEACDFFNGPWFDGFRQAIASKGIFVVMSAGNLDEGETGSPKSSTINFPGCLKGDNFLTVGSISQETNPPGSGIGFSDFSYTGIPSIDFVTPGRHIFSTTKDSKYEIRSGTSASAAIFSGIIYARGGKPTASEFVPGNGSDSSTLYPIAKVE